MATTLTGDSGRHLYPHLLWRLLEFADHEVSPRGQLTHELEDVTLVVNDPTDVLLTGLGRANYHPAIGAAEGLLLLAGLSDPALLERVAPAFSRFKNGGALHGAYGPRVRDQLQVAVDRLRRDPDSRQATVVVWDPRYDVTAFTPRDLPCTVSLAFRVRDDELTMKTHMRSNDAWLGWPYDSVMFTLLQCTVANLLGLVPGKYVHHADSLHLYDRDVEAAWDVVHADDGRTDAECALLRQTVTYLDGLPAVRLASGRWADVQQRAEYLLYSPTTGVLGDTEGWLRDTLEPFLSATKVD